MTDNTNDTYVDEDAFGTPCLWLINHPSGPELLLSKDDIRISVNRHKPNAHWGAPSRDVHVDRLWDAIAATAGEAPKDDDEPTPEQVEAASAPGVPVEKVRRVASYLRQQAAEQPEHSLSRFSYIHAVAIVEKLLEPTS
jgi:hypothetical protein